MEEEAAKLREAYSGAQGYHYEAPAAAPAAEFIASFDDDDFSLPSRLRVHVERIGASAWLSASRKFIAIHTLDNIVGFEHGRCFGAGMIRAEMARTLGKVERVHGVKRMRGQDVRVLQKGQSKT